LYSSQHSMSVTFLWRRSSRWTARGSPAREHAPHRAQRSLDAPARHRRRRRPTSIPEDDEGRCELTEPPHLDVVQPRRSVAGGRRQWWMAAVSVTGGLATSPRMGVTGALLRRSGACRRLSSSGRRLGTPGQSSLAATMTVSELRRREWWFVRSALRGCPAVDGEPPARARDRRCVWESAHLWSGGE